MDKQGVSKKMKSHGSAFAILDKISDIESLLNNKVSGGKEDTSILEAEKSYKSLKEQLFESFYTSSDIEDIIIDPQHQHHELVMRLYHEYMDEGAFLEFDTDNIEQEQEETETYFYFTDSNAMKLSASNIGSNINIFNSDLNEHEYESVTELHTAMNLTEIYNLENKIESLVALLDDMIECHRVTPKTIIYFLGVGKVKDYQDRLNYIMSNYVLKQKKYGNKLEKIDDKLRAHIEGMKGDLEQILDDRYVLKSKKKAGKIKNKMLSMVHNTYRDLDLIHEKLYSLYHHLNECIVP